MMNNRCEYCGRFVGYGADSGTYYGSYFDYEPPDPVYFCKKCVEERLQHPEDVITGCWWLKPDYVRVAKAILRHRRKLNVTIRR